MKSDEPQDSPEVHAAWLRFGQLGDERARLAMGGARPSPSGAMATTWILGAAALVALALTGLSCESGGELAEHEKLSYHAQVPIGAPMEDIIKFCDGPVCKIQSPIFSEIEYVSDSAAKVKGYILRTPAPDPPNVQESQAIFERTRQALIVPLGGGESFLKSGDPTYWPRRGKEERVVTLTSEDDEHTVLAVGAVGPDSEKIPTKAAAHDPKQVAEYWSKIARLPALAPSGKK